MWASVQNSRVIHALCLAGALCGAPVAAVSDVPARVVSMNLCTDQLAMLVAGAGQLVSVSHVARDPLSSAMAKEAAAYPVNHGLAEEIYLMQPDLVITGSFTARATVDMLTRLGIEVVMFEPAATMAQITDRIEQMGAVLGQQKRAAALITEFDTQLAAFQAEQGARPRAALYYANGYTLGDKTLAGQILTTAGLANIAAEYGFSGGGVIPLEVLAMAQPDTVITGRPYPGASRSEEIVRHPVIDTLRRAHPDASISNSDWVCGTPFVLRAIDDMVALRREIQKATP
nr:ABC transporter substrate-binding protein [Oceaniglobus ichthyenteri]